MGYDFFVVVGICLTIAQLIVSIIDMVRRKQGTTVVKVKRIVVKVKTGSMIRKPPKH